MTKFIVPYFLALSMMFTSMLNADQIIKDARKYMVRGRAAMDEAKEVNDYQDAVEEFRKATEYAPGLPAAWFNLGFAQEKAEDYAGAIKSLNKYLELNPDAKDYTEVEDQIFKLGYKQDKQTKQQQATIQPVEKTFAEKLNGKWTEAWAPNWNGDHYESGNIYSIKVNGEQIKIIMTEIGLIGPVIHRVPVNKVVFNGSVEGNWMRGTYYRYSSSSTWSRDGVLVKKTVHYQNESSVDGPINLSPNGELHIADPLGKLKRVP